MLLKNKKSKKIQIESFNLSIVFFYLASVAYLVVEVGFNFSMLNAVSSINISESEILDVKSFGRVASSVGFTLFALGFFYKNSFIVNKENGHNYFLSIIGLAILPYVITPFIKESAIAVICIALGAIMVSLIGKTKTKHSGFIYSLLSVIGFSLITFPAFYYGKPAIVSSFIVDISSGEDRLLSKYAQAIKEPLIDGSIQLDDISIESFGGKEQPEAKAFLAMIGPIMSSSQQIKNWLEDPQNKRKISEKIVKKHPDYQLDDHWEKYQSKAKRFKESKYGDYKKLSSQYVNAEKNAQEQWLEIEKEKDAAWKGYKNAQQKFIDSAINRVSSRQLNGLNRLDSQCDWGRVGGISQCQDTLYENAGTKFRYDLCPKMYLSEKFDKLLGTNYKVKVTTEEKIIGVIANVLSLNFILNPDPTFCSYTKESVGFAIATNVKHKKFERLSSNKYGLDLFIFSESDFMKDERFLKGLRGKVNSNFKKEGLNLLLDKDWDMDQYEVFVQNTTKLIQKQINTVLNREFGRDMRHSLIYEDFEQDFRVQNLIKKQLSGEYIENFSFEWDKKEFYGEYFLKIIDRQILREITEFEMQASQYDNGSELEEEGKKYKRLIIVPPIAIALSLFFSFTSLAKVVQLTLKFTNITRPLATPAFFAVLLFIPILLFISSNQYLETNGWRSLKIEGERYHPNTILMAEFVLKIEPYLYESGKFITEIWDYFSIIDQKK